MLNEVQISSLKRGSVGVVPTDTLYGLVAPAGDKNAVARLYAIKGRSEQKPFIILISSLKQLTEFGVNVTAKIQEQLNRYWPGPVSIVLPTLSNEMEYLHRGTQSLAFRLPNNDALIHLIQQTGPLVAPSANPEGESPARTIDEAQEYFGSTVDFYVDGGALNTKASKIISLVKSEPKVIRE